ncbi:MAG: ATP-binding protein [Candidatus Micrarchaeaceae archaeon]
MSVPYLDRLIVEVLSASRESSGLGDLLAKSGQYLKYAFGADEVFARETLTRKSQTQNSQADEAVLNTGKPYIDNRLSEYSAFPELIEYYKAGFRSCAMLPISADGRNLGLLVFLSRLEDKFDEQVQESLYIMGSLIGTEAYMKLEREKSLSVARYFDAAFNSIMPQALIDQSGMVVKANKSMLNLAGIAAKDVQGKKIGEFFAIDDVGVAELIRGRSVEARGILQPERRFLITANKISEKLTHTLIQDYTEIAELREKARLFDYAGEVYMLADNDSRVFWISGNAERAMKINAAAFSGVRLADVVANFSDLKKMADNGMAAGQVKINLGNDLLVDARMTLVKRDYGYSCILVNDYEKKVAAAKRLTEDFLQVSGDIVIKLDQLGSITTLNRAAEKMLRYKNSDVLSVPISSLCADSESQARIGEALPRARKSGLVTGLFLNIRARAGEAQVIPVDASILSMTDDMGAHIGYLLAGKELLTKMLREQYKEIADDARRKLTKETAESDLKTQFIYNISHDLKTPLTSIQGYSKLLLMGELGQINEEQRSSLETISAEAERLKQLIMQILDVAKLESKKVKLDIQKVNFRDLAENPSIKALAERAKAQGIEFAFNVDYNVPEINADPNRLIQVFVNLIDNALKFTERGSIRVNVIRKGRNVKVDVTDTGVGIRKEDLPKVFKKFYQVSRKDLTMQPRAGTGLGLSIVREIVNMHGGRVKVNSEGQGKGSTFWFTIPIEQKKKRKQQEEQQQQQAQDGQQAAP